MNVPRLVRSFSIILLIFSLFMLLPMLVALYFHETVLPFLVPAVSIIAVSGGLLLIVPSSSRGLTHRDSFVLVSFTWILICVTGSLPFFLSGAVTGFVDALFESTSGFTTTGSSIFSDVETLPYSLLFWRALTHWIGGMGIIVLAVAVLPFLGISGYQLMAAEAPGPEIERVTPRITHTAKVFWLFYVGFTVVETVLLMAGGLTFFDAITHTFATLATGGFSTKNGSIASFNNPYAEWVVSVFMILSGINFTLYYRLFIRDFTRIKQDTELKSYILFLGCSILIVIAGLFSYRVFTTYGESVRKGVFQVATLLTSTGFATADYTTWPFLTQSVLLLSLFIGGCVGSTSGGIKMMHVSILAKSFSQQIKKIIHPQGVFTIHYNRQVLPEKTRKAIAGFVTAYVALVLISTVVVASSNTDLISSLTASLAVIGNIGPGFGEVGPTGNFGFFPDYVKVWLSLVMILGRLEIYTVLVLLTPSFYR